MAIKGIDVSYAQGNIDWAKVKASGVSFAMIRACYGWDDDSQIDRYFRVNVQGCEAVGMPYGLYHYSYAQTPEDAEKEARFFASSTGAGRNIPLYLIWRTAASRSWANPR